MALFTEGKLFKKAGEGSGGGGGGDQHNLGWYATQSALETAHPTATAGDWAIVGSTDTVWIWDTDTSAWKDSDQKGQVTSVNGQTGDVVLDLLPSQTGNAGKFLTTDGTDASWSDKPLVNYTTESDALQISATTPTATSTGMYSTAVGNNSRVNSGNGIAIGRSSYVGANALASIAIGTSANCYNDKGAIIIGGGSASTQGSGTFSVSLSTTGNLGEWHTYKVVDSDGTIPKERLANVVSTPSTMPTLAVADWSNNTQTVNVTGVTATNTVFVSPAPASAADYASAGIVCTAQGAGTLTFTCTTTPTNAITVNVVCL